MIEDDDASFFVEANEFAFNGQSVAYEWFDNDKGIGISYNDLKVNKLWYKWMHVIMEK